MSCVNFTSIKLENMYKGRGNGCQPQGTGEIPWQLRERNREQKPTLGERRNACQVQTKGVRTTSELRGQPSYDQGTSASLWLRNGLIDHGNAREPALYQLYINLLRVTWLLFHFHLPNPVLISSVASAELEPCRTGKCWKHTSHS